MMVRIGNFLFHYRNGLFPVVYLLIFLNGPAVLADGAGVRHREPRVARRAWWRRSPRARRRARCA